MSEFYLQFTGTNIGAQNSKFAFTELSSDSTGAMQTRITSSFTPTTNTWYYLVGVYDASDNQISLYVNGVLAGTQTVPAAWNAGGETVIGRAKWNGATTDFWPGSIDDVQIYDRALSAQEVTTLYNAG